MRPGFKIVVIDDGFLGKYIARELSEHYNGADDKVVTTPLSGYSESTVCDLLVDATGSVGAFPPSCRLTVSLGAEPSDAAAVRFALPAVVGTGMRGPLMEMARSISRGVYYHLKGDEMRVSVVHAVDVARAVALVASGVCPPGAYILSDGHDPLVSEVAEGLAFRLGQKRVYTLPPRVFRWLAMIGVAKSADFGRPCPLVGYRPLIDAVGEWKPVNTVEYLKNHDYGNDDF